MPEARLSLVSPIQSRTASLDQDAKMVNVMVEGDEIVKRPGLTTFVTTTAGQGQGIFSWDSRIIAGVDNHIYTTAGSSVTELTGSPIAPTGVPIRPLSFNQTANDKYLVFHNETTIFMSASTTGTPAIIQPLSSDKVLSATIQVPGGWYNSAPTVTFDLPPSGVRATGTAVLFNHQVSSIVIANQGSGYVTAPQITMTGSDVTSVQATGHIDWGSTYIPGGAHAGGGDLFTFTRAVPTTTTSGLYYLTAPKWSIPDVGWGSSYGTTTIDSLGRVISLSVTQAGRYPVGTTPSITIDPPTSMAATATSNMANTIGGPFAPGLVYLDGYFYVLQKGTIPVTSGGTVTITPIANPAVITWTNHGLVPETPVIFTGVGGTLPTGITAGHTYYVLAGTTPNTFSICDTAPRQAPIATTAAGTATSITISATYSTNGRIYGSGLEDPSTWNALNFIVAGSDPDPGVAIAKHLNYLVAFGQWSTEFFYNAGNPYPSSPLAPNQAAKLEIGCANGYTVAQAEHTVIWVGQSLTSGRSVYLLEGTSPRKISNRHIDKYLNNTVLFGSSNPMSVRSYVMKLSGHTLYVLTLEDFQDLSGNNPNGLTLVYDLDEQEWYVWNSRIYNSGTGTTTSGNYFQPTSFTGNTEYSPGLYLQDDHAGIIYKMDPTYYDDAGQPIDVKVVTPIVDGGTTKRKFYKRVEVVGDKVIGQLYIYYYDDDYHNVGGGRLVVLSDPRPVLYQCGSARRRAWMITCSDPIPLRLKALEIEFDIGEMGGGQQG